MHYLLSMLAVVLSIATQKVQAKEVAIFDSRKSIALSKHEKTYKDFYVNAGVESGLRRGVLITVVRSASLYDAYQNKTPGDLTVPVGQIKIIHSQKGLSVGRLHKLFSRSSLPVLEYEYIMVGDCLDLSTITRIKKKVKNSARVNKPVEPKKEEKLESVDFASSLPAKSPILMPDLQ